MQYNVCAVDPATDTNFCTSITPTADTSTVNLTIPVQRTISGTFTDRAGNPIANASLKFVTDAYSNDPTPVHFTTDASGNYSVNVAPGVYAVRTDGVIPSVDGGILGSVYDGNGTVHPYIDATNGNATQNLQFDTVALNVHFVDPNGNPIPNAQVSLDDINQNGTTTLAVGRPDIAYQIKEFNMPSHTTDTNGTTAAIVLRGLVYNVCAVDPVSNVQHCVSYTPTVEGTNSVVISEAPPVTPPTNLTAPTPTNQNPALSWSTVSGAISYNIYREGTEIGSSTTASFTDSTAPTGTDNYYVTAVDVNGAETSASNTFAVVYDTTPPTISYSLAPAPNSAGWNNTAVIVTFSCNDSGTGVGIATCTVPVTLSSNGTNQTVTGTAVDNAGNSTSVTTTPINIDRSVPTVGTPSWSANPVVTGNSTTLTAAASASVSAIVGGEYYIGSTDPGQGSGTAMSYSSVTGNLTATFGSSLTPGTYQVNVRTENAAGVWSNPISTSLVVMPATIAPTITSANSYSIGIRQIITPLI